MPELPEVETVRLDLHRELVGRRIDAVVITGARTVRRGDADAVTEGLTGRTVVAVDRRGKHLVWVLDNGRWLVVHLRMSGQLLKAVATDAPPKHTHARIAVAPDGSRPGFEIRFVDPRTFGELFLTSPDTVADEAPGLAALGPEPLDPSFTAAALEKITGATRRSLKNLLTDQRAIAGLGNIYSDEVLHVARLRPERAADTLAPADVKRLHRALGGVLNEAVAARGSSLADEQYVDLYGHIGGYQHQHRVFAREGEPCPRCRTPIVRSKWAGRSSFACPRCQL